MIDALYVLLFVYLSLAFTKFCFLTGTMNAAVGTYYRYGNGRMSKLGICSLLLLFMVYVALIGTPGALRRERFRFFSVYSNFGTMRDIVRNFRGQ
jgi:hypothetical protein